MDRDLAINTLKAFCSFPISTSKGILEKFAQLPNAIYHKESKKRSFVYIRGWRDDRVLLVAHADTVWDEAYYSDDTEQTVFEKDGVLYGKNNHCGIGADDRAGCAILWLLKDLGHSLLITDGEEYGCIASRNISVSHPDLFDELNSHCYMVQFDRRECDNYKVYNLPVTKEFVRFVEENTGYSDAGNRSSTDIVVLARDICAVNLGIGYHNEHTARETIVIEEWLKTLNLAEKLLVARQEKFPLQLL